MLVQIRAAQPEDKYPIIIRRILLEILAYNHKIINYKFTMKEKKIKRINTSYTILFTYYVITCNKSMLFA